MKKWSKIEAPRRILIIRLQATGDTVATLPYAQSLREKLPAGTRIDLLTREECCSIPQSLELFNEVHVLKGGRSSKKQLLFLLLLLPKLLKRKYEVALDLQNNRISRICRKMISAQAWVEFDKYSPIHSCERYKRTIDSAEIVQVEMCSSFQFKKKGRGEDLLKGNGWNGSDKLVLINPAGAFITRNWPMENYAEFCHLWLEKKPSTKFLVLGLAAIAHKAKYLEEQLGNALINMVGKTTPAEAFEIVQQLEFAVSEDSALMHMAYLSGIPVVGLLGSTRNDWTDPCLKHTRFFHSADLTCGNCMRAVCMHNDVRCLTRIDAKMVVEKAEELCWK